MSSSKDLFSRVGYSCVFENNMDVVWSNNSRLFRKLVSTRLFSNSFKLASSLHSVFEFRLMCDGIRYRIQLLTLPDKRYLGVAYPEECYIKYSYSEMYMRMYNIKRNASNAIAAGLELKELLMAHDLPDEIIHLLETQIACEEAALCDSTSILKLFDTEHICEYVMIREKLENTHEQVKKYSCILGRKVSFDISFKSSVARINYIVLDTALLEIARVMFKYLPEGAEAVLHITERMKEALKIRTDIPRNHDFDTDEIDYEIRDLNCAFECLGGRIRVYHTKDTFVIDAYVPSHLSNYVNRVKSGADPDAVNTGYEDLKGYGGILSPHKQNNSGYVIFRCPSSEPEIDVSWLLSDIMLTPLYHGEV